MFDNLNAKYDPFVNELQENKSRPGGNLPPAFSSWRDSAAVVNLSEYLGQHKDQGIKVCQTEDGRPSLCFSPGLVKADLNTERWHIAEHSLELLETALPDLERLLIDGLLTLPRSPAPLGGTL